MKRKLNAKLLNYLHIYLFSVKKNIISVFLHQKSVRKFLGTNDIIKENI